MQLNASLKLLMLAVAFGTVLAQTKGTGTSIQQSTGMSIQQYTSSRMSIHLATDKPIYRLGETLFWRGTLLDVLTRRPVTSLTSYSSFSFQVFGPKGDRLTPVTVSNSIGATSVIGSSWTIPKDITAGEYTILVTRAGCVPAERKFEIRAYRNPTIQIQVEFVKKGYSAGEKVTVLMSATRAEGGAAADATVTATAMIDGQKTFEGSAGKLDSEGKLTFDFVLPQQITVGDGTLTVTVKDGAQSESYGKTIPILLQHVDVRVYPESGDVLLAGIDQPIYFEAFTPSLEPADITVNLVKLTSAGAAGDVVVEGIATSHEGRGRFVFPKTAESSVQYALKVISPGSINQLIPLPALQANGAVLSTSSSVISSSDSVVVHVSIRDQQAKRYQVAVYQKEKSLAESAPFTSAAATLTANDYTLALPNGVAGVLRVTLSELRPVNATSSYELAVSERLVFRTPASSLSVSVEVLNRNATQTPANAEDTGVVFAPASPVKLRVQVKDSTGRAVPQAIVQMAVTDDSTLQMIEKRKQAPRLSAMVYLEDEVEHLEDAALYLNPTADKAKASQAIDLLLGTQGWRRFVFSNVTGFVADHQYDAKRVLGQADVEYVYDWRAAAGGGGMVEDGAVPPPMVPAAGGDPNKANPAAMNPAPMAPAIAPGKMAPPMDADERIGGIVAPRPIIITSSRVFAYQVRADRKPNAREEFTETVYWNAGEVSNDKGQFEFAFNVSDSITTYRIRIDSVATSASLDSGVFGQIDRTFEVKLPFYLSPKLPLQAIGGDRVHVPIGLINSLPQSLSISTSMSSAGGPVAVNTTSFPSVELFANERARLIGKLFVGQMNGEASITFDAHDSTNTFIDTVTRKLKVIPAGFPIDVDNGGRISSSKGVTFPFDIPADMVAGSLNISIKLYPSPAANLMAALIALIQQPYGCFEQTSSVTYPMVMALLYFKTHTGVDPAIIQKTEKYLADGYAKLVSYEVSGGGFEWFGAAPAHESLTAYGLLQFIDMQRAGFAVDAAMVERTKTWLMSRKTPASTPVSSAGFVLNPKKLDTFGGAPQDITNAYIVWALTEAGLTVGLDDQIEALVQQAASSTDGYFLGLVAGILNNVGRKSDALPIWDRLLGYQGTDGGVTNSKVSITGSRGESLLMETTSISVLGWLNDEKYTGAVEKAIRFIIQSCKDGRFGSTQATILALKAIIQYDVSRTAREMKAGSVALKIDSEAVGSAISFGPTPLPTDTSSSSTSPIAPPRKSLVDTIDLFPASAAGILAKLGAGQHVISIQMTEGFEMPYSIAVRYSAIKPKSHPQCPFNLTVKFANDQSVFEEGQATQVLVTLKNALAVEHSMTVVIVGIPGGFEPRYERLQELVKQKSIAFYELFNGNVVLYWRGMAASSTLSVQFDVVAAVPGVYTGAASRAYPYYTDEQKVWVSGLAGIIQPSTNPEVIGQPIAVTAISEDDYAPVIIPTIANPVDPYVPPYVPPSPTGVNNNNNNNNNKNPTGTTTPNSTQDVINSGLSSSTLMIIVAVLLGVLLTTGVAVLLIRRSRQQPHSVTGTMAHMKTSQQVAHSSV